MNRKKQILRQRSGEVARAGRMFFEAIFTPRPQEFFHEKGVELERELAQRGAIPTVGELVENDNEKKNGGPR